MIEHMVEQQHRLFLCRPNGEIIVQLNGVRTDSVEYNVQVKDYNQITFTVDKYIIVDGQLVKSNGYDDLEIYMNVLLDGLDMFQIQQPVIENDGTKETKVITGYSREKEFEDKDWTGLKVNTGEKDSLEYLIEDNINEYGFSINPIVLYDAQDTRFSLIHYILSKMPSWSVDTNDVDPLVRRTKIQINEDNINLYALLTSVIGPKAECLFLFDTLNRKIKVVSKQSLDEWYRDTGIYISFRNLANSVKVEVDEDSVFTVFTCRGEEDLDIRTVNYNDDKIYDLSYFMGQPWMDDSLVNKIKLWEQWRELNREDFIVLTKDRATLNDEIYELNYQVPNDADFYTQWDNMEDELLLKNLAMYQANLDAMRASVDENPQYDADGNYIPWKKDGKIDDERYLELLLDNKAGYYTYIEITTYIIPNIEIAIRNKGKKEDEKEKYIREYETNWDLYGIIELEAKEESYVQQLDTLKDQYAKDWDDLTPEEKQKWTTQETYNIYHNRYVKFIEWLGTPTTEGTLRYRLAALKKTRAEKEARLAEIDSAIADYANLADITNELWGLTSDEIDTFFTLCHHTDYTNTNILTTSSDTTLTTVDVAKTLLEDSVGKLAEVSQPQMKFSVELDNFLDIPEFAIWKDSFKLLNFIRVGIRDDYFVKLRLVGYKTNPCEIDPMIDVEFSNFITSRSGRSDLTELLDTENNRGAKNSISIGTGNSKDDREYVTTLLQIMTKSGLFQSAVGGVATGVITVGAVNAGEAVIGSLTVDEAYIRSLVADEISATTITTDQLFVKEGWFQSIYATYVTTEYLAAQMADIDILNTQSLTADSAFITSLQTMNSTAITSTVNDEFVTNLIAGKISVADLAAGDITLSNNMRIVSENGNLVMNGTALQIIGKDSDNQDYVGVQLGYDTSGNPSLILRNEDGATVLTPQGITEDAVADQLINNDMLKDNSISEEKLSFQVTKTTDSITLERIQHDGTSFSTEYTTFRNNYNNYTTSTNNTLTSLQNQINNIEVGAPNGIFGARQQYYLSDSSTALVPEPNGDDGNKLLPSNSDYTNTVYGVTATYSAETETCALSGTNSDNAQHVIFSRTVTQGFKLLADLNIGDTFWFGGDFPAGTYSQIVYKSTDNTLKALKYIGNTTAGFNVVSGTVPNDFSEIARVDIGVYSNATVNGNARLIFTTTSTAPTEWISFSDSLAYDWTDGDPADIPTGKYVWTRFVFTLDDGTEVFGSPMLNTTTTSLINRIDSKTGEIMSLITQTDIDVALFNNTIIGTIRDRVVSTEQDVNGITRRISDVESTVNGDGTTPSLDSRLNTVEDTASSHTQSISAINTAVNTLTNNQTTFTQTSTDFNFFVSRSGTGTPSSSNLSITADGATLIGGSLTIKDANNNATVISGGKITTNNISNTAGTSWINLGLGTFNYGDKLIWNGSTLNVEGNITANSGYIAAWEITPTMIRKFTQPDSDGVSYRVSLNSGTTITDTNAAAFVVEKLVNDTHDSYPAIIRYNGGVYFTKGTIGGLTIESRRIFSDSDPTDGYIAEMRQYDFNSNHYAFIVTDRTGSSNTVPFSVKYDGSVVMTKANVTGTVTANDGKIGGWTITSTAISKTSSADNDGVTYLARLSAPTTITTPSSNAAFLVAKYVNGELDEYPVAIYYDGRVSMKNATISGVINATSGSIGGWTASSNRLFSQSASTGGYIAELRQYGYNENNYAFIITDRTGSSPTNPFRLKYDGTVVMTKATVTGTINANDGSIGNWTIGQTAIYNGMTSLGDTTHDGAWLGTNGIALGKGNFKVTNTGVLTAKSGTIGGWSIGANNIMSITTADNDGVSYRVVLNTGSISPTQGAIYVRKYVNNEADTIPFVVRYNGSVRMTNADITGTITATGGTIGGFTTTSKRLYSQSADTGGYIAELRQYGYNENNYAFIVTDRTGSSSSVPFAVKYDGSVIMTKATVTGTVTATNGNIGGWTVSSGSLFKKSTPSGGVYYKVAMNAPSSLTTANVSNVAAFVIGEYNEGDDSVSDYKTLIMYDGSIKTQYIEASGGKIGNFDIYDGGLFYLNPNGYDDIFDNTYIAPGELRTPLLYAKQIQTDHGQISHLGFGVQNDNDNSSYLRMGVVGNQQTSNLIGLYYDRGGGTTNSLLVYDPDVTTISMSGDLNLLSLTYLTQAEINALF